MSPEKSHTGLYRNQMSYLGGAGMAGSAVLIVFALIGEATIAQPGPYVGIFTYLVFPGFFVTGLAALLLGMRREARRRQREGSTEQLPFPVLDLNVRRIRRRFVLALGGAAVAAILFGLVGYKSYLYSGSNEFCGTTCHSVMGPEHTAYLNSSHARVPCVDCHVGAGASWFVKSKLSGAWQVIAVTFGTYDKPIATPIHDLRPARETCERCHWPKKFYPATLLQIPHFRYDEQNSAEQISLLVRTGGGDSSHGQSTGIHWHMAIENEVTYAATDPQRQVIPVVSSKRPDGTVVEYRDQSS
ncbi:MAG: NapC/NirT family cytochrome c, partial [Deltaproteobacteria bacterium]|nr:NapC/NirT family cytochrome c [Deltaproteobacteria bacterium]